VFHQTMHSAKLWPEDIDWTVSSSVGGSSNKRPDTDFGQPTLIYETLKSEMQTESGGTSVTMLTRGEVLT
jgi:hypothetical protein